MARKRKVRHELVVKFAQKHPEMLLAEIGVRFGLSSNHVSLILRTAGVCRGHKGRPLKRKHYHSDQQSYWETLLHDAGLGMEEGMRINGQRIFYGFDGASEAAF